MKQIMISVKPEWIAKKLRGEKVIEGEIWKEIPQYEGLYIASNYGRIISLPRNTTSGKLLTPQLSKYGYYVQSLTKNGKRKLCRTNRLIALTFLSNPNNLPMVNHINGIKTDNRDCNLEWCDGSHNQKEAYRLGLQKPSEHQKQVAREMCQKEKSIKICAIKDNQQIIFPSMSEASRVLKIPISCISRVVRGKRKQTNGYVFKEAL